MIMFLYQMMEMLILKMKKNLKFKKIKKENNTNCIYIQIDEFT